MNPADLKRVRLFESVDEDQLRVLAAYAASRSVAAGEAVVKHGEYAWDFMGIVEGEVEVVRDGEELAILGPGDYFGETALLNRTTRNATVRARTPLRLVTLTHWDIRRLGLRPLFEGEGVTG